MSSPGTPSSHQRLGSIAENMTEDTSLESRRASLLESRLKELDQASTLRRRLLRDLYFTMKSRQDPLPAVNFESPLSGDESSDAQKFLKEWDIMSDDHQFRSISFLDTDFPSPVSSHSPSEGPESFSPDPLALRGKDEEMDVDMPDRSVVTSREEAQVNATLNVIKDESDGEEALGDEEEDRQKKDEVAVDEEQVAREPEGGVGPVLETASPLPKGLAHRKSRTPSSSSLSESEFQNTQPPFTASAEIDVEMEMPMSPPRRTLSNAYLGNPHFRHTSVAPSPPASPSFSDLVLEPKTTVSAFPLEPLVTPYALSLYPLPPPPNKKDQRRKDKSKPSKGLELYRWQATIRYNPVSKWFPKATKCLSSKEWAVGFAERRFVRAMHQVDTMKEKGRWSFRQPKRSKGPTLVKVHWDYLLDEMRWLQTDFREERKWKMATAFEIAHAVADWHRAAPEEKKEMCVRWRAPDLIDDANMEPMEGAGDMPIEIEPRTEADTSDDPLDTQEETTGSMPVEQLEEVEDEYTHDSVVGAGADTTEKVADTLNDMEKETEIKEEAVVVDLSGFRGAESAEAEDADAEAEQDGEGEDGGDADAEGEEFKQSLLGLIQDPDGNDPSPQAPDGARMDVIPSPQAKSKNQRVKSVRVPLLQNIGQTDTLIDLSSLTESLSLGSPNHLPALLQHESIKLPDLFPELTTYGPFMSTTDSKGKPEKRVEETTSLGKISYASRLLDVKPVLISTLQPAKKHKAGGWDDLAEFYPGDDSNQEVRPTEFFLPQAPPLFSGPRKPKEYPTTRAAPSHLAPEQAQLRVATQIWTAEEDAQLKHLAYLYSLNWNLVADAFASWRKSISTDRRTEWDCMVRWDRLYGPTSKSLHQQQQQSQQQQGPHADVDDNVPIGSRKASRSTQSRYKDPPVTPSVSLQMMPPPVQSGPLKMSELNRKQIRRGYMYEAIKRVVKKRDIALNKSASNATVKSRAISNIHETHALSGHIFSPMELSAIKMERDRKTVEHMEMRKKEQLRMVLSQTRMGTPNSTSKLPVGAMMAPGANQVAQIRNMQAAQLQQQQRAQAQAQAQAQAANGQQSSSTSTPPMSRVPTVSQQALLAQQSQIQAQLAVAHALHPQSQSQQGSPPRPGSSASMNGSAGSPQGAAQQQQQLLRAQQQLNMAAAGLPFDPSMVSGMSQEQIQVTMQQQQQMRLMMQQAQQNQLLINNQQAQLRAANITPVQSAQGSPPNQMSPGS